MATNWRSEIPQWIILIAMFAVAMTAWPFAPERIPVHWNLQGEIDRYGGRFEGLLLMPLVALAVYGLLLVISKIDPARSNYESFRGAWLAIRSTLVILLALLHVCIVLIAFGYPIDMGAAMPLAIGVMFVIFGNLMGKIRPNWFVGIRTPWTLSSRTSWNKTHRLAGRLFILIGVALGTCAFVRNAWMLGCAIALALISVIWMTAYSYFIWRGDPERLSPGSISPSTNDDV